MTPSTQAAIEIHSVTKRFGDVVALEQVSLSIQPRELFFLLGPSGCGKSTLLRILAGLETPDSGSIHFNGKNVSALPPHKRGAPMVFQNYALWPHLSVKDNVGFGLVERGCAKNEISKRVKEALDQVDLGGLEARMPGQLSGGQQQRVALARALVINPEIILLDEPLSNLDAKLRLEMRHEIERLHQQSNLTLIYVTHDQSEALGLADRMAVMEKGHIRALGTPHDLYRRPPNQFCARFLGEANLIRCALKSREDHVATVETPLGTWKGILPGTDVPMDHPDLSCMIRPENLIMTDSPNAPNSFEAEVVSCRLNGSTVSIGLRAGKLELRAILLSHAATKLNIGEKRRWKAEVEDTVVLGGQG